VLRVEISDEAGRFLLKLPTKHAQQIDARIMRLAAEPFPPTAVKLQGTTDVFRVRQGPNRILYRVDRAAGCLVIEAIGSRRDIYRRR
jgi:mRNA interferase RelE/StbE